MVEQESIRNVSEEELLRLDRENLAMKIMASKDEFIDFVYTMHLQNTNGRETHDEMFKLGIESAYKEMTGFIAFISIEESLPERNKYVLVKTPFCKYPAAVAYWNGIDWIDTTDKCKIMNVEWWRPLNVD